jgi:hypothetical protein
MRTVRRAGTIPVRRTVDVAAAPAMPWKRSL